MDIPVLWLLFGLACYVGYAQGVCPSGQWGDTCQNTCSAQCFTSTPCRETTSVCGCQQTTGRCQTCNQGYFGENCTFPCSDSCTVGCNRANGECANVGDCSNCLNGENSCVSGKCTACKHQMFGETCDTACSFCDRGCEQDNGQCYPEFCANCEGGVANCDTTNFVCVGTCISGTYGNDCQQTCAQFSGISNCITCIETTDPMTCGACSEGYYSAVTSCSPCSDGCVSNSCAATDGSCLQGCISGRGGRMCDQFKCEVSNCATCQTNQHLQCLTCNSGYYLTSPACTRCHENCISRSCDVTSGRCSFGCVDGWYGDKCENKCGNCSGIACDRDVGSCIGSCVPGYTGSSCKDQCSSKCLLSCDKFTGTCNACPNGKYGETCDYQCTSTCNDISCEQLTGNCIATCQTGYYGAQCSTPCSTNCVSSVCDKIGGRCTIGCNSGYHGDLCLDQCPVRCFPRTCFRSTGQCSNACIQSFHGAFCNETCSSSCEGGTCQKSSGYCSQGCKSGFWGNTCADQCATGCAARCVQTLGVCLAEDGCRDGFFGNYCNITCNDRCADNKCLQTNGDCEVVTKPDGTKNLPLIIGLSVAGGILIPFSIAIICCCQRSHGQDQATLVNGNVALVANGDSKEYIGGLDNISSRSFTGSKYGQVGEQISIHAPLGHLTHRSADAHSGSHVSSSYNTSFNPTPHLTGSHLGVSHLSADRIVMSSFVLLDGTKGVKVEDFSAFMTQMKMSDRGFEMELATLHQGLQHPHAAAMRPENRAKNRYKDVYPYDHSRVILNADDGDYTDYINASYIDGYQSPKAYIACQGPTENMVNDFWRMIWQLNCQTIIMVTNLVEGGVTKCMQYWPEEGEEVVYGEFTIACDDVERYTDFRISNLNVSSNGEMKTLRHAQFLSWPDKEVPKYVTPLVEFHDKVKSSDTPCVVHCSAGVGRSGTYIAMDYLLEQADTQGSVNVHECVAKMRDSRVNMIQTAGQYQFLHVVLEAALKNRDTTVSVEEFSQYYNVLRRDSDSHSHLHRQFENLTCPTEMEYEAAHMPENLPKNRNANILPPDDCRVYLWSRMKGCNDYINAVYLPTFKEKYAFIATEFPQNRTVVDFCRLVYQEECRTIVMMNNTFSGDKKHENYWGGLNQQMGCGPFQIKVTREEVKDGYKVLTMEFRFDVEALAGDLGAEDKGSVQLRQYQYSGWEEGRLLPSNLDALLNMIDDIRDWNASSSAKGKPLIVHCMDGAERSGLFCVMAAAVERLRAEENVSMVHTINQMRVRRPQVIPNIEQFRYCHEAILQYIEHHYNNGDIIL
ncbi:uncharacterized protein LOC110446189 isoform X5 [Mizuhopecten yessoensis]|uniref:uncharacterized protein LOC110446189 isoform X5 n=1 Tax=Mizuhopecten yessoensis TaxID=6573 RepID=UPI000B457AC6|nr:uncharacterized protein LOC110446189 isoform X5 [Mizuhopecten yessoensis]